MAAIYPAPTQAFLSRLEMTGAEGCEKITDLRDLSAAVWVTMGLGVLEPFPHLTASFKVMGHLSRSWEMPFLRLAFFSCTSHLRYLPASLVAA